MYIIPTILRIVILLIVLTILVIPLTLVLVLVLLLLLLNNIYNTNICKCMTSLMIASLIYC